MGLFDCDNARADAQWEHRERIPNPTHCDLCECEIDESAGWVYDDEPPTGRYLVALQRYCCRDCYTFSLGAIAGKDKSGISRVFEEFRRGREFRPARHRHSEDTCDVCGLLAVDEAGDPAWSDGGYWDRKVCPRCTEWGSLMQGIEAALGILGDWERQHDAAAGMSAQEYAVYSRDSIISALRGLTGLGQPEEPRL